MNDAPLSPEARASNDQRTIDQIQALVSEAVEVRFGSFGDQDGPLPLVDPELGPQEVHQALLWARARSDRMDRILSDLTRVRGVIRRRLAAVRFDADNAYDRATQANAGNRTREFSTREERHADAALDSFNERRAAFEADRLMDVANEGYELVRTFTFELKDIRSDIRATLHTLAFESSLER